LCSLLADQSDWDVYEADNGEVALDRIPEIKPDVVVLAIMMTEMNGLEAANKIRNLAPETRVIFMSSHFTRQEAALITGLFGGNFVQKANLGSELIPTISRLLLPESQALSIKPEDVQKSFTVGADFTAS
jgi:DNA-binding NarL/FixJ family response regulator